jgi:hypothetical protein
LERTHIYKYKSKDAQTKKQEKETKGATVLNNRHYKTKQPQNCNKNDSIMIRYQKTYISR